MRRVSLAVVPPCLWNQGRGAKNIIVYATAGVPGYAGPNQMNGA